MQRLIKNRLAFVALVLLAMVYLAFLALDLFAPGMGRLSGFLKYAGILLCLAVALLSLRSAWNRKDAALLVAALFFTAVADLFLLLLNLPIAGLLVFCIVQLIYIWRYRRALGIPITSVVLAAVAGCFVAEWRIPGFPLENVLAGLYGTLLLTALLCSIFSLLPKTNRRLASVGMVLFLLCDIHVALFNVLPPNSFYYPFAAFLMWFFYLPAQGLLAVSAVATVR